MIGHQFIDARVTSLTGTIYHNPQQLRHIQASDPKQRERNGIYKITRNLKMYSFFVFLSTFVIFLSFCRRQKLSTFVFDYRLFRGL